MPRVNWEDKNPHRESVIQETMKASIAYPVMLCGVNRKVSIGNFENCDIYAAVAIPIMAFPEDDLEKFKQAANEAAELGFRITSKETGDRYDMIAKMRELED